MFHFVENDSKVTEASKNLIRTAFKRYSSAKDKDLISKTDFKCAWLYLFGYKISKYELCEYFEKLGKNYYQDGLNMDEFEKKAIGELKRLDLIEELRNAFIVLDFLCKGFLTEDDVVKQFKLIAPHLSHTTVRDVFCELDRDCDGRISYKDFELAMQYIQDT